MKHKYNYFYKITNVANGHFYYGVHSTDNLNDNYMGSGVRLHLAYKKYGIENFKKEIIKFFDTVDEAYQCEAEVVNEYLVRDPNCYNLQEGGGFHTNNLVTVKDKNGNCFDVFTDDPRYLSGELVGVTKEKFTAKDKNGNFYHINKNDERFKTGELVGVAKGYARYKDKDDNVIYCSTDDDRVKTGELINFFVDKVIVKDKHNNCYAVSITDERYISGELVPIWKGRKHNEETRSKMSISHQLNKDQQGEKNSQYGTCWIYNDSESIKIKKEDLNKYLSNGWIKGRKIKFNGK